jgi:hypothetical protein
MSQEAEFRVDVADKFDFSGAEALECDPQLYQAAGRKVANSVLKPYGLIKRRSVSTVLGLPMSMRLNAGCSGLSR